MLNELRRYENAAAMLRVPAGGVGRVDLVGLCTLETLAKFRRDVLMAADVANARALVVDFRRTALMFGLNQLPIAPSLARGRVRGIPIASLALAQDEQLFLEVAVRQAQEGLVRAVFTEIDDALDWASARADGSSVV